ncbi:outer membrane beta-barrel protein [Lacinutrix salivirga]
MFKNNFLILFFLLSINVVFSQQKNLDNDKGDWIVTNQIGFGVLEAKNAYKLNVTVFEGSLLKEFKLKNNLSIIGGIENLRVTGNFFENNNQLFLRNNYLNIPLLLRLSNITNQKKASFYGDLGFYGAYLLKSKTEDIASNTDVSAKNLGFNFGLQFSFGLKYKINDNWNFNIGMKSKSDLINSYENSSQEFTLTQFYAIQIGLGLKI